jgi:MFS family permease
MIGGSAFAPVCSAERGESENMSESSATTAPANLSAAEGDHYDTARARNYALVLLTIVYSFNFIDRQLLAILQESIKLELSLSDSQLGLLTGFAFALFYVTAGLPIARWADRSNRRNIVAMAVGLWSLMTAISGMVQNYGQLLAARIGVGVGEAGGSPPSHSIISDIFPAHRRASAIAFYSTGVNIGILFGFLFGGWLNEYFGWRVAFRTVSDTQSSFMDVVGLLWSRVSFRHIALASALNAFAGYSTSNWTASFMIRSHGMTTGELGTWLALIMGFGGAIGVFGGGLLADRLASSDRRWYMMLPAFAGFICVPFMAGVYLVDSAYLALTISIVPGLLFNVYLGNAIATTHGLVGLRMRATASAILFLILNIIGLGLGPWSVGILSDVLEPSLGNESLRYAMLYLLPAAMFWSACHFYLASRSLKDDLDAAPD